MRRLGCTPVPARRGTPVALVDRWELYIPSEMGYGDKGNSKAKIRGGDVLVFTMEMVECFGDTKPEEKCYVGKHFPRGCSERETKFLTKQKVRSSDGRGRRTGG